MTLRSSGKQTEVSRRGTERSSLSKFSRRNIFVDIHIVKLNRDANAD